MFHERLVKKDANPHAIKEAADIRQQKEVLDAKASAVKNRLSLTQDKDTVERLQAELDIKGSNLPTLLNRFFYKTHLRLPR